MRLFRAGKGPEVAEIICRRLTAVMGHGVRMAMAPTLGRCGKNSAFCIPIAMFPDERFVGDLVKDASQFRFILIIADSAPTNRALIREWAVALTKRERLIVAHGPCWKHILGNCDELLENMCKVLSFKPLIKKMTYIDFPTTNFPARVDIIQ